MHRVGASAGNVRSRQITALATPFAYQLILLLSSNRTSYLVRLFLSSLLQSSTRTDIGLIVWAQFQDDTKLANGDR